MRKTLRVKIFPGKHKIQLIRQSLGNTRFLWNKFVNLEKQHYGETGTFLWFSDLCRIITKMRAQYPFLGETSVWPLQQIARKFAFSLRMFVKHKDKGFKFPKYKRKIDFSGILIYPKDFKIKDNKLYLPKIGWVRIKDKALKKEKWHEIARNTKQVWVKEAPEGFFTYLVYEDDQGKRLRGNGKIVGIDVGIKNTITLSTGQILSLPVKELMKLRKKAEKLQSIIDKKKDINKKRGIKYSKTLKKLKVKLRRILWRANYIKRDFYYKAINHILNSHEYVVVEDINLKALQQSKKNGKKVSRKIHKYLHTISLSELFRCLEFKAKEKGREIVKVNPKNTSKTCSNCGYVLQQLPLSKRVFKCPSCGAEIDRDLNAALNILNKGLEVIRKPLSQGHGEYRDEMGIALYPEPHGL